MTLVLFPFQTGFPLTDAGSKMTVFVINICIEAVYILDICILLLTPIYYKGDVITGYYNILKFRLKSVYFYLDLIAAYPSVCISAITYNGHLEVLGITNLLYIMKMFKVRYMFKIIDKIFDFLKMASQGDIRRISKLAIALAISIHIMA